MHMYINGYQVSPAVATQPTLRSHRSLSRSKLFAFVAASEVRSPTSGYQTLPWRGTASSSVKAFCQCSLHPTCTVDGINAQLIAEFVTLHLMPFKQRYFGAAGKCTVRSMARTTRTIWTIGIFKVMDAS